MKTLRAVAVALVGLFVAKRASNSSGASGASVRSEREQATATEGKTQREGGNESAPVWTPTPPPVSVANGISNTYIPPMLQQYGYYVAASAEQRIRFFLPRQGAQYVYSNILQWPVDINSGALVNSSEVIAETHPVVDYVYFMTTGNPPPQ